MKKLLFIALAFFGFCIAKQSLCANNTPSFMKASSKGDVQKMQQLILSGTRVFMCIDRSGQPLGESVPLGCAIKSESKNAKDAVELLLNNGAYANDFVSITAEHKTLLQSLNIQHAHSYTLLTLAVLSKVSLDMIQLLLTHGAEPNNRDSNPLAIQPTPIEAAKAMNQEALSLLDPTYLKPAKK